MIATGCVVRSNCGRDKGRFFVVVRIDGGFLFLADGKLHKLSSPKKKNASHVSATKTMLHAQQTRTDKQLRKALFPFNYGESGILEDRD